MRIRVIQKPAASKSNPETLRITPATIAIQSRPLRVLDFDIENRPLSYLGSDFTTAEVTAIAWAWTDRPSAVTVRLLGESSLADILREFVVAYDRADLVVGHFIRGHDVPMVNGALMELGLPVLTDRMTHDTKIDACRSKGISMSQESLGAMLRLEADKVQMNQIKWRAANRLTPAGIAEVRKRVVGDVQQHIELYAEMLRLGYLGPPKMWRSGAAKLVPYTP